MELLHQLTEAGVPCGKVNTLDEIFRDESKQNMIVKMVHPIAKKEVRFPGIPVTLSRPRGEYG